MLVDNYCVIWLMWPSARCISSIVVVHQALQLGVLQSSLVLFPSSPPPAKTLVPARESLVFVPTLITLSPSQTSVHGAHYMLLDSISDLFPVLHPHHKLKYFKNAGWSEKCCRAAYVVTQDTYEMYYKNKLCSEQLVLSDNVCHSPF